MTENARSASPENSIANWLLHWLLLFTAMAASFFFLEPFPAALGAAAIGALYLSWWVYVAARRGRDVPRPSIKVWLVLFAFNSTVPLVGFGLTAALILGWTSWAYQPEILPGGLGGAYLLIGMAIVAPLLFLAFGPALARENGGVASRFLEGVRERGFVHFHRPWLGAPALALALICLLSFVATVTAMHNLQQELVGEDVVTPWELSAAYPFLPVTLLIAALMLCVTRLTIPGRKEIQEIVHAYTDAVPVAPALDARARTVLGALVAGGWVATIIVIMYPVHLGLVAALGAVSGIYPLNETAAAVETWITEQREAGTSTPEIAAELNRIGSWSPDAPDAGLATLVEDSDYVFSGKCSVLTSAGVANPPGIIATGRLPAEQAASDLKYCIAVRCASPVAWDAPPALLLGSSHDSQAAYWSDNLYIDVFAEGRAAAPGGYCTADGGLADEFQG